MLVLSLRNLLFGLSHVNQLLNKTSFCRQRLRKSFVKNLKKLCILHGKGLKLYSYMIVKLSLVF